MGNAQSAARFIAKAKSQKEIVLRDVPIDPKWIPSDAAFPALERLVLINVGLPLVPEIVFQTTTLEYLTISGTDITSITGIASLSRLKSLILPSNKLDWLPDDLAALYDLEVLDIHNNRITNRGLLPELFTFVNLRSLDISNNRITKMPTEFATLGVQLREIHMHGNPWVHRQLQSLSDTSSSHDTRSAIVALYPALAPLALTEQQISLMLAAESAHQRHPDSQLNLDNAPSTRPASPPAKPGRTDADPSPLNDDDSTGNGNPDGSSTATGSKNQASVRSPIIEDTDESVGSKPKRLGLFFARRTSSSAASPSSGTIPPSQEPLPEDAEAAHSFTEFPESYSAKGRESRRGSEQKPGRASRSPSKTSKPTITDLAPISVERTAAPLQITSRAAGPRGRKPPSSDFIKNKAVESQIPEASEPQPSSDADKKPPKVEPAPVPPQPKLQVPTEKDKTRVHSASNANSSDMALPPRPVLNARIPSDIGTNVTLNTISAPMSAFVGAPPSTDNSLDPESPDHAHSATQPRPRGATNNVVGFSYFGGAPPAVGKPNLRSRAAPSAVNDSEDSQQQQIPMHIPVPLPPKSHQRTRSTDALGEFAAGDDDENVNPSVAAMAAANASAAMVAINLKRAQNTAAATATSGSSPTHTSASVLQVLPSEVPLPPLARKPALSAAASKKIQQETPEPPTITETRPEPPKTATKPSRRVNDTDNGNLALSLQPQTLPKKLNNTPPSQGLRTATTPVPMTHTRDQQNEDTTTSITTTGSEDASSWQTHQKENSAYYEKKRMMRETVEPVSLVSDDVSAATSTSPTTHKKSVKTHPSRGASVDVGPSAAVASALAARFAAADAGSNGSESDAANQPPPSARNRALATSSNDLSFSAASDASSSLNDADKQQSQYQRNAAAVSSRISGILSNRTAPAVPQFVDRLANNDTLSDSTNKLVPESPSPAMRKLAAAMGSSAGNGISDRAKSTDALSQNTPSTTNSSDVPTGPPKPVPRPATKPRPSQQPDQQQPQTSPPNSQPYPSSVLYKDSPEPEPRQSNFSPPSQSSRKSNLSSKQSQEELRDPKPITNASPASQVLAKSIESLSQDASSGSQQQQPPPTASRVKPPSAYATASASVSAVVNTPIPPHGAVLLPGMAPKPFPKPRGPSNASSSKRDQGNDDDGSTGQPSQSQPPVPLPRNTARL